MLADENVSHVTNEGTILLPSSWAVVKAVGKPSSSMTEQLLFGSHMVPTSAMPRVSQVVAPHRSWGHVGKKNKLLLAAANPVSSGPVHRGHTHLSPTQSYLGAVYHCSTLPSCPRTFPNTFFRGYEQEKKTGRALTQSTWECASIYLKNQSTNKQKTDHCRVPRGV